MLNIRNIRNEDVQFDFRRRILPRNRLGSVNFSYSIYLFERSIYANEIIYSSISFSRLVLFSPFFRIAIRGKFWWFRVNAFQFATVSNKRKRVRRPLQRRLSKQCLYLHEWTLKDSLRLYDTRDQHADPSHVTCSFDSTRVQTQPSRVRVHEYTYVAPAWYADAPFPGEASASRSFFRAEIFSRPPLLTNNFHQIFLFSLSQRKCQ